MWARNNGSLQYEESIYVDVTSGTSYQGCFRKLFVDNSYLLMLTPSNATPKTFRPLEAPLDSSDGKVRRAIFNRLCASSCKMKITLPKRVDYYQGQMQSIFCRVGSLSPVTEVQWFKDATKLSSVADAGLILRLDKKDNSELSFNGASAVHVGTYKCVVRNQAGQHASAETRVEVTGPLSRTLYRPCDRPDYCMNGGKCHLMHDGQKSCECGKFYRGGRCEQPILIETFGLPKDNNVEEMKKTLSHLTTALTAVSITLFFVSLISLTYVLRTKNKKIPDKNLYDEAEQISLQEIPPDSHKTPSNLGSTLLEEPITPVRIFVEDSEHTVEIFPSPIQSRSLRTISDQYLSVVHQNLTPCTPLPTLKNCNDKSSLSTPVSPCPSAGSAYTFAKRERLNGSSFS